ncbi:MAG: hypothetical protein NXY57DRAFT_1003624 [Lentinula lateritia]|nr:MAG: hypothetical protein NXY57DRAFT_1003624 [Lentinula lateritia]
MEHSLPLVPGFNPSFLANEVTIDVFIDSANALDILTSKIFIALQFSGGIGMLLLLVTALVSRTQFLRLSTNNCTGNEPIKRSWTWYSFCISWMISSSSYCLLFFAMEQFNPNEKPSHGLCLTQAALVYSSPPLTGATTFSLLLEIWLMFRFAASGKRSVGSKAMVSLLIAPYVLWVLLTVGFLILGGVDPSLVQRDLASAPYCVLNNPAPPILVSSLTLIFALGVMIMLCNLVISMHRTRTSVTHDFARHPRTFMLRASQSREGKSTNDRNNLKEQISPLVVRLIVFNIGGLIAIIVSIVFVLDRTPDIRSNLALAVLPPIGVIVFGTQMDFLQLWISLLRWTFLRCGRCIHMQRQKSLNGSDDILLINQSCRKGEQYVEIEMVPAIGTSHQNNSSENEAFVVHQR